MASEADFAFAERALHHGYATEAQVQECLSLLERLRTEMSLEESLANLMVKKGYLAPAQAHVLEAETGANRAGKPKNAIEGYRLLERIGAGAMGSVYKADHLKLSIHVALKVLNPSLASSRTQIERLKREAQLAARLNHPNVVRSLDVGSSNGFHYLAMEFVEGTTVRDRLAKGPLPEKEALGIARQVALGLAHAHAHGVVHRDVKPGNIMLTREGTAKLADFGLARGEGPSDLTLEHASIGTPQYVAPEQMRRGSDATPRSDLFSVGSTLYHMVTGRPPFDGENLGEIVQNVLSCEFEPPERLAPELSRDAIYVIDRLMRANPRERYASANELALDLERIERGDAVAPPDFLGDYQAFLKRRRGRRIAILAACAALLAVVGGFFYMRARSEAEHARLLGLCGTLDGRRADAESLGTLPELRDARVEMEQASADAANAGCPDGTVANLRARLKAALKDEKILASAEKTAASAREAGANYRGLGGRLADLDPAFAGVRKRVAELQADVRACSDDEAEKRYTRESNNGFRDLETAKRDANAFAADLGTRYLPLETDWTRQVAEAPRILDEFERAWGALAQARRDLDAEIKARRYGFAAKILTDLRAGEVDALDPVLGNGYLRNSKFSNLAERANTLDRAERREWNDEILVEVARLVDAEESRPDSAEPILRKFRDRASGTTRDDVDKRLKEVRALREDLQGRQEGLFAADERHCLGLLRERLYMSAHAGVARVAGSGRWLTGIDEKYRELLDRARRMTELTDRFLERVRKVKKIPVGGEDVPGDRIERAPGDDKDLFVARLAKGPREFRLRDLPRKDLVEIFAFGGEDRFRRGWFYAAEAYREDRTDPYMAEDLREKALGDLDPDDPWAAKVSDELKATRDRIREGEARAKQADAELVAARAAHDDVKALALVIELIETLRWTRHCTGEKLEWYQAQRVQLERLMKSEVIRLQAGVPPDQFAYGSDDGAMRITLRGVAWHPDEAGVAPDAPDRAAKLDRATEEYWTRWFRSLGRTDDEIKALVPRAKRQLLFWSGPVEAAPEGGYRPTAAALLEDAQRQWMEKQERPLEIGLEFPFRPDRSWSIEFEVEWPHDPGFFVVAAGKVQAVVGYQRIGTMGGMAGACILVGEDLDPNAHARELGDLHWHMVNPPKGEKAPRRPTGEKAFLDESNFVPGVPCKMKLQRDGEVIRFEMHPVREPGKRVLLEKRDRRASLLDKDVVMPDGRRLFRFLGASGKGLAYQLREVTIEGILLEPAKAEAGKQ